LKESVQELQTCREILDKLGRLALSPPIRQRVAEDAKWFDYASNTMNFYYYLSRTYIRKVEGDLDGARKEFDQVEKFAQLLREQQWPFLIPGVHAPNQADKLKATGLMPAYEWLSNNLHPGSTDSQS
jgi:hypothetical protein